MISYHPRLTGFALSLAGAALASGGTASAQVLDFNTLPVGETLSTYTENGITLTADDVHSTFDTVAGAGGTTGAYFHETSPPMMGPFGTSFTFTKGGAAFSLISIDILSGFGAPVEYIASNGATVPLVFVGVYTFGPDFANITSFQQITQPGGFSDVTIDNVTLGPAVPEPGANALLVSLGLTGAAFLRRKRMR